MSACEGVGFYPSLHEAKLRDFDVSWGPERHCYCAYVLSLFQPIESASYECSGGGRGGFPAVQLIIDGPRKARCMCVFLHAAYFM